MYVLSISAPVKELFQEYINIAIITVNNTILVHIYPCVIIPLTVFVFILPKMTKVETANTYHGQKARTSVFGRKVFIIKLESIDGNTSTTISLPRKKRIY